MADVKPVKIGISGLAEFASGDTVPVANGGTGATDAATAQTNLGLGSIATASASPIQCGRLTLTSGTPILTSDVTGASTIYYTPHIGDVIALYDGTTWTPRTFTELSRTLASLTSGKNYDVVLYLNSDTLTLDLMPAWTNDTTRSSGVSMQNGVYVNTSSFTSVRAGHSVSAGRAIVVGTIRTTGTSTTESSGAKKFVWNLRNQIPITATVVASGTHNYNTATTRAWNNDTTFRAEWVTGLPGYVHRGTVSGSKLGTATGSGVYTGLGLDSTTASTVVTGFIGAIVDSESDSVDMSESLVGYHYAQVTQLGSGVATCQWYGGVVSVEVFG